MIRVRNKEVVSFNTSSSTIQEIITIYHTKFHGQKGIKKFLCMPLTFQRILKTNNKYFCLQTENRSTQP